MFALLLSIGEGILSFFTGRILGEIFGQKSPVQVAVNTAEKMAQDEIDAPDKGQAVKVLERGDV